MTAIVLLILTFVELNTENMFDTKDNPAKQDDDFTPAGLYRWTSARYWDKTNNIGKELLSCGEQADGTYVIPDLIALTEIENDSVLKDLTRRSVLRRAGYEYIITDSPDVRGINVALLYSPLTFAVIQSYPLGVTPLPGMRPTRDILYVEGRTAGDDTLHVFVVHSPSRLGGEYDTRAHRRQVTSRLAASVDSLQKIKPEADIIIAGDFNESSGRHSLKEPEKRGLTDISADAKGANGAKGTYKYRESWETIDHVIVSTSLAGRAECRINDAGSLLTRDTTYGGVRPNRNFYQTKWMNGFSDHLPIVATLLFE